MLAIFDIDGTLANCDHRLHHIRNKPKNFKAFYAGIPEDTPIAPMVAVYKAWKSQGNGAVFVTGRPITTKDDTEGWLAVHLGAMYPYVYYRPDRDYRPDTEIKREAVATIESVFGMPDIAFDDRPRILDMYAEFGIIPCKVGTWDGL